MNPKVANFIAIEAGILIGLMSWLTYSHFPSSEPRTEARMQESNVGPVRTVAPQSEAINQRLSTADYNAEREQARLMAERSVSLASRQRYEQAIATEPYVSSIAADSPSYSEVNQEPAVVPTDYLESPQTVIYAQPIVVFSNPRRFANRCRSTRPPNCAPPPITHQCPDRRNLHPNDTRVVVGPNISAPPFPPTQGSRARENVRQTGVTGGQQKRTAVPGSAGAGQRSVSVP